MDTTFVLFTSFIALVGLQMCVPEKSNSGYEAHINELLWTDSPLLRVIYGKVAGVVDKVCERMESVGIKFQNIISDTANAERPNSIGCSCNFNYGH